MGAFFSALIGKAGLVMVLVTVCLVSLAIVARNWSCREQRHRDPKIVTDGPFTVVSAPTGASLELQVTKRRTALVALQYVQAPASGEWATKSADHLREIAGATVTLQWEKRGLFRGTEGEVSTSQRRLDEKGEATAEAIAGVGVRGALGYGKEITCEACNGTGTFTPSEEWYEEWFGLGPAKKKTLYDCWVCGGSKKVFAYEFVTAKSGLEIGPYTLQKAGYDLPEVTAEAPAVVEADAPRKDCKTCGGTGWEVMDGQKVASGYFGMWFEPHRYNCPECKATDDQPVLCQKALEVWSRIQSQYGNEKPYKQKCLCVGTYIEDCTNYDPDKAEAEINARIIEARIPTFAIATGESGIELNHRQIANGYADAAPDAPKKYKNAAADAKKKKIGIWR